jgi:hypothetical protein
MDFSGAPESSNWPPGSSEMAAAAYRIGEPDDRLAVMDRLPAEQCLHALEERADAPRALVGHGTVAVLVEAELLVLRADAPSVAWLRA